MDSVSGKLRSAYISKDKQRKSNLSGLLLSLFLGSAEFLSFSSVTLHQIFSLFGILGILLKKRHDRELGLNLEKKCDIPRKIKTYI